MYHNNVLYCYLTYFNVYRRMFFWFKLMHGSVKTWRPTMQIWWWPPCFKLFCLEQHHCSKSTRPDAFDLLNDFLVSIFFLACKALSVCTTIYIYIYIFVHIYIYVYTYFHSFWFASIYRSSKGFGDLGNFRWTAVDQRIHLNGPLVGSLSQWDFWE